MAKRGTDFDFYGLPLSISMVEFSISDRLSSNSDYSTQWRRLTDDRVAPRLLPHIKKLVDEMGLNDYLTYRLVSSYVDARFPRADASARMAAVHYLLAHMGYDVRIATSTTGVPLLLIAMEQTVYGRVYMLLDDKRYYIFAPDDVDMASLAGAGVYTCSLPDDASAGRKMDLTLGALNIPFTPHHFSLAHGPLRLEGDVNANLMPILYRYPQTPIDRYACAVVDPALRRQLIGQVQSQLSGMDPNRQVEALLGFMHNVFQYATDGDNHGFEKPYFIEETLFYPKNDCEDRAIFYTYFLWNALGLPSQLVSYPGHEAAAVALPSPVKGTSYDWKGTRYYISDPTYEGSHTGMVMPQFTSVAPTVDYTFGSK